MATDLNRIYDKLDVIGTRVSDTRTDIAVLQSIVRDLPTKNDLTNAIREHVKACQIDSTNKLKKRKIELTGLVIGLLMALSAFIKGFFI